MQLKLKSVRLSYPALFEPKAGPEGGDPKYSASLLMDKDNNTPEIATMRGAILAVAKAQWGEDKVKWNDTGTGLKLLLSTGKVALVKVCLRDGEEKGGTAGYENVMFFSASSKLPVPMVDKNPAIALTAATGKPYAGCYVNASVRLWAQDNNFGKRVNAQLQAIQFAGDGESFGDGPVNPETVFENEEGAAAPAGAHAPAEKGEGADQDGW